MTSPDTTIAHVHGSNLPNHIKGQLTDWYRKVTSFGEAELAPRGSMKSHMAHQIGSVRQLIGSGATGLALSWAQAELPHGLDLGSKGKLALDGIGGVLGAVAGSAMAAHGVGVGNDVRNAGAVGFGIFTFRKGHDFWQERRARKGGAPGGKAAGIHGEDPILAAARELG